jgi:hypothetical protein
MQNIIYRLKERAGTLGQALAHYSYDEADVVNALVKDDGFAAAVRKTLQPVADDYWQNLYELCDVRAAAEATKGMTLLDLLAYETSKKFSLKEDKVIKQSRLDILHKLRACGYVIDAEAMTAYRTDRRPALEATASQRGIIIKPASKIPEQLAMALTRPGWQRHARHMPPFDASLYSDTKIVWRGTMSGSTMTECEQAYYYYTITRCKG